VNRAFQEISRALVLVAISATAMAGDHPGARDWLERMASAMNHMSYQGTFVYMRGHSIETMRITHVVTEDGIQERLYSVNGPHREVIRDKDGVRCVLGDDKQIMEDPMVTGTIFPDIPLENLDDENAQYRVLVGRVARVAGHNAQKITISPADKFRYGYEFWLEENSGLLLKWVVFDTKRRPMAHMMFTELKLGGEIRREELLSETPSAEFVKIKSGMPDRKSLTRSTPRWKPATLPPGFKLASHSIQENEGKSIFEHQVYSDGLASVSVYVENLKQGSDSAIGASKIGTANAFSREVGSKQVTVIGEVPKLTVRTISDAVIAPASDQ
jgi:sigma-E factor negative regulatory protein RseB